MTKQELRTLYLQKRSQVSASVYHNLSISISKNLFQTVDLSVVHVIHTFLPIEKNKEPNTFFIIERLQKEFSHIKISVPKVNYTTHMLESFYFEGIDQLEENVWNILEPKKGILTNPKTIDIVLVPLIVFDKLGHRTGYGKGYYDKFLPDCRPDCKKIGISLFEPVDKIDDVGDHDQKLDLAITPTAAHYF
jgi:5-formyltetrahydrofolate cyclo-ligase